MEFSKYLKSFANENNIMGDLSRDFIESKSRARTYIGVVKSMKKYQPCEQAWEALQEVYRQYLEMQLERR